MAVAVVSDPARLSGLWCERTFSHGRAAGGGRLHLHENLRRSLFLRQAVGDEGAQHVSLNLLAHAETFRDDFLGNSVACTSALLRCCAANGFPERWVSPRTR